jgi:hypothetical protein
MMESRYFWCDAPSPLHEEFKVAHAAQNEAVTRARELAKSFGAEAPAINMGGFLRGFVFAEPPPEVGPYYWHRAGKTSDTGGTYYVPRRRTKVGKQLDSSMLKRWFRPIGDCIVARAGLYIMRYGDGSMNYTTAGWRDGRIFIQIPSGGSGDEFPKIPAYLTECKQWEMDRWFDLGRAAVEAAS